MNKSILLIVLASACAAVWAGEQVNTIDARTFDADGLTVTSGKVEFTAEGKKESLDRPDVSDLALAKAPDPMVKAGACVLRTVDGAQLVAVSITLSGTTLHCDNVLLGATDLPIEALKVIYMPDGKLTPQQVQQRCQELKADNGNEDILVVAKTDSDWTLVDGVFKGIDAENVTFTLGDTDRAFPRKSIRALYAAALSKKQPQAGAGTILGVDGSSTPFAAMTMDAKTLAVDVAGLGKKTLNRADVAVVRFNSNRVVNLSDLKPTTVNEHGLLDQKFPYRVNASVDGKELKLGGQAFAAGLGMHSFCELTYALDGAYGTFVAVAGIDDSVRPAGDATVTLLGDGKKLGESVRVTGKDKPVIVRAKIAGVKQLMIRVEYGEDKVDVSDHVDLVSARLIK